MARTSRAGLDWDDGGMDLKPRWARKPDIEAIKRVCCRDLGLANDAPCTIAYLAACAFNKAYTVQSSRGKMIMRVSPRFS